MDRCYVVNLFVVLRVVLLFLKHPDHFLFGVEQVNSALFITAYIRGFLPLGEEVRGGYHAHQFA